MGETKKDSIRRFLKEFKKIVTEDRGLDIIPRRETRDALAKLGLTRKNCEDEIMTLSVSVSL